MSQLSCLHLHRFKYKQCLWLSSLVNYKLYVLQQSVNSMDSVKGRSFLQEKVSHHRKFMNCSSCVIEVSGATETQPIHTELQCIHCHIHGLVTLYNNRFKVLQCQCRTVKQGLPSPRATLSKRGSCCCCFFFAAA